MARPSAFSPRVSVRGLESENNLGALIPESGGLKPDGIGACSWFHDLKVVAIPEGRGNVLGIVATGARSSTLLPGAYDVGQNRLTMDRRRGLRPPLGPAGIGVLHMRN